MTSDLPEKDNILIGVISDTHGVLIPAAVKALKGVHLIIHAGDVGNSEVLSSLGSLAPVVAVRGNMDAGEGLHQLPATETVEINDMLVYIIHDVHQLDIAPLEAGVVVVIFGHTHRPSIAEHKGVLFLNPGSAAQPRHNFPATIALLRIQGGSFNASIIDLDGSTK
jgi:uncharacterized protein